MTASDADVELIAASQEVLIETRAGTRTFRTVIWVVVDEGTLFIRSFLGDTARWYRRAIADPEVALVVGDTTVSFLAVPATDDDSVRRASDGFHRKYRKGRNLDAMVRSEVLQTTLRLDPVA